MNKAKKYFTIVRISLANAIAYRANTFSRFAFYTLFIYVFMNLWQAIYKEGSVHGYSYVQMVWYLIMTELIVFSSQGSSILNSINEDVKSGAIAYQLGRPVHYIFLQCASTLGQVLLNLASFGILAVVLGFVFVGPLTTFRLTGLLPLLFSVALGLVIGSFFMTLIGLSAFIFEDNFALYLIYQKICFMLGVFLPVEFLPDWLQPVAKNLPFSYIAWAPAKIFVNYSPELGLELISRQAMWAAVIVALTLLCYELSARRLQVNGG
jgi:ABC-2 type transport system permease protein